MDSYFTQKLIKDRNTYQVIERSLQGEGTRKEHSQAIEALKNLKKAFNSEEYADSLEPATNVLKSLTRRSPFDTEAAIAYVQQAINHVNRTLALHMRICNSSEKNADKAIDLFMPEIVDLAYLDQRQ